MSQVEAELKLLSTLVLVTAPLVAQDAGQSSTEFQVLLQADGFYGAAVGEGGEPSDEVLALRMLLERPAPEAQALFLQLLERATAGGQLYALCGLYLVDRPRFEREVEPFLSDERQVEFCPYGCVFTMVRVRDVVRSTSPWAVRLPKDFAGADWRAWVASLARPRWAQARPDLVGGAFPVEFGRHAGFGEPRSPEGALEDWLPRLEGADPDEVERLASQIARVGGPGFDAVRDWFASPSPHRRQAAAAVVRWLGVEGLGREAELAAGDVGALLHDPALPVAQAAAEALYQLWPWTRSAQGDLLEALEGLPQRLGGDPDEAEVEFATYLAGALAFQLGEEAVSGLIALLDSPIDALAVVACESLERLGPVAARARPALARSLDRPLGECALLALQEIGVEPGSDEHARIVALLRGDDPQLVQGAARLLGAQGRAAGPRAAEALRDALVRAKDAEAAGALALARWRVSGATDGLVQRLVSAHDASSLVEVLERTPTLAAHLAPFVGAEDPLQATALRAAEGLGRAATALGPALRELAARPPGDLVQAERVGRALFAVLGDPAVLLRVMDRSLERDLATSLRLVEHLGPAAVPVLNRYVAALAQADGSTRVRGLRSLRHVGRAGEALSVPWLEAAIADPELLGAAITTLRDLAQRGSPRARAALVRIAGRGGTAAAEAAADALERLRHPEAR